MTKLVRFNINFYADGAIKYAINMHYAQTEETLRCVALGQAELIEVTVAIGRAQELADKARKSAAVAVERANEVFPTRVGMNRADGRCRISPCGVPHTRGDEPKTQACMTVALACSPHAWG